MSEIAERLDWIRQAIILVPMLGFGFALSVLFLTVVGPLRRIATALEMSGKAAESDLVNPRHGVSRESMDWATSEMSDIEAERASGVKSKSLDELREAAAPRVSSGE